MKEGKQKNVFGASLTFFCFFSGKLWLLKRKRSNYKAISRSQPLAASLKFIFKLYCERDPMGSMSQRREKKKRKKRNRKEERSSMSHLVDLVVVQKSFYKLE